MTENRYNRASDKTPNESRSDRLLAKIQADRAAGKPVSDRRIDNLAQAIEEEAMARIAENPTINTTVEDPLSLGGGAYWTGQTGKH